MNISALQVSSVNEYCLHGNTITVPMTDLTCALQNIGERDVGQVTVKQYVVFPEYRIRHSPTHTSSAVMQEFLYGRMLYGPDSYLMID